MDFDSRDYFLVIFYCTNVHNIHGIGKILKRRIWEIWATLEQYTTTTCPPFLVFLSTSITMNLPKVDFLDITMDLTNASYYPFKKPNNELQYINKSSNHPPNIIKQLPKMIEKRLSDLSHNETEFERSKAPYENALKTSGFNTTLQYVRNSPTKRSRSRSIIYFNPPYNASLTTNIGKSFLSLIDKHFPAHNRYSKIFNRNTIKISYSCTPNMKLIITAHNKGLCEPERNAPPPCNCRRQVCPLEGKCRSNAIIYKATVTTEDESETKEYIGSTETEFKLRYSNHKYSFNNILRQTATKLSQYIWKLKNEEKEPKIKWKFSGSHVRTSAGHASATFASPKSTRYLRVTR